MVWGVRSDGPLPSGCDGGRIILQLSAVLVGERADAQDCVVERWKRTATTFALTRCLRRREIDHPLPQRWRCACSSDYYCERD